MRGEFSGERNVMKRAEVKKKISGERNPMKCPEQRERMKSNNPMHRPEVRNNPEYRKKLSEALIHRWKDPVYRARQEEARRKH
jgi:hypothetical protein